MGHIPRGRFGGVFFGKFLEFFPGPSTEHPPVPRGVGVCAQGGVGAQGGMGQGGFQSTGSSATFSDPPQILRSFGFLVHFWASPPHPTPYMGEIFEKNFRRLNTPLCPYPPVPIPPLCPYPPAVDSTSSALYAKFQKVKLFFPYKFGKLE